MNKVTIISAMEDNYIYLCEYAEGKAFVVDPGQARPVEKEVEKQGLELTHIFLTHHHYDHIGGVSELENKYGCEVMDNNQSTLRLGQVEIEIIPTPGHTRDSVCFYISRSENKVVFTGDTLFVGGCGRPMECSKQTMWESLQKLLTLPGETLVYCGHDYTLDNYNFALCIERDNEAVKKCIEELKGGKCPVPSSIAKEKQTNVLLRSDCDSVKEALEMEGASAEEVFAELRIRKNAWG